MACAKPSAPLRTKSGFAWILDLHRRYNVPANLHLSGTLIEAIAWHQPDFLLQVRELIDSGLIEVVGKLLRAKYHAVLQL